MRESRRDCIFCKIVAGDVPAEKIYEDTDFVAIEDLNPQAPVHCLVLTRQHIENVNELTSEDTELMGRLFTAAREVARRKRIEEPGYRLIVNTGRDGGQTVYHIHMHVMGGRFLTWPPG